MISTLISTTLVTTLFVSSCHQTGGDANGEPPGPKTQPTPDEAPAPPAFGDRFPEVLAVKAVPMGGGRWRFSVTLSSPYDTPKRYADAWRVLDGQDRELGVRILGHDHGFEQPFTRSKVIQLPEGQGTVFVEGRDQLNGWSGQRFEVRLEDGDQAKDR